MKARALLFFVLLLPAPVWASAGGQGIFSFIPYTRAALAATGMLDCRWMSTAPHGRARYADAQGYDFLCKGGTWGTVTLMYDKGRREDSLHRVRLIWREWDPAHHPAGGEANIANIYLGFVVDHFIPQKYAAAVRQAFWSQRSQRWSGRLVNAWYEWERRETYALHRLEITGTGEDILPQVQASLRGLRPWQPVVRPPAVPAPPAPAVPEQAVVPRIPPAPLARPQRPVEPPLTVRLRREEGRLQLNALSEGRRLPAALPFPGAAAATAAEVLKRDSQWEDVPISGPAYRKALSLTEEYSRAVEDGTVQEYSSDLEGAVPVESAPEPPPVSPLVVPQKPATTKPLTNEELPVSSIRVAPQAHPPAEKRLAPAPAGERIPAALPPAGSAIPPARPLEEDLPQQKYEDEDQIL
jgi:hypothetical protein